MFKNATFIKANLPYVKDENASAPLMRKTFELAELPKKAVISFVALGYGVVYINGYRVTEDKFLSPVSDYTKTLWYTEYDVTSLLQKGKNVIAAVLGNGWYNEFVENTWLFHNAPWRDNPKLLLQLDIDGKEIVSDESWVYTDKSPVVFNQLRLGEYFDARLYDKNWNNIDFDDSSWTPVKLDDTPPTGVLRKCECEPLRECEYYQPQSITKLGEDHYLFDFGQNMSGYARLKVNQPAGDLITLEYGERCEDVMVKITSTHHYKGYSDVVQVDKFTCSGEEFTWTPEFTYHGFRYVDVKGIKNPTKETLTGVFVHQDVKRRSSFNSSNEKLNKLFENGIYGTYSNMFYQPTDCPTREKMGWCNDAQASTEQFLTDFEAERFLEKWMIDLRDAMKPNGALPVIVPTGGWGYEWGNGPVCDGVFFEVPYRLYLHTGNKKFLVDSLEYFDRYLALLKSYEDENQDVTIGLCDWAAADNENRVSATFINSVYRVKFLRIAILAAKLSGKDTTSYENHLKEHLAVHNKKYTNSDGTCKINRLTSVAMTIYHDIYEDIAPLASQLAKLCEEMDFHHDSGMVGVRHLYSALNKCGLEEYAYKIITAKGYPSYFDWLCDGATTLYEHWWERDSSFNHHMYSDFMSWMIKTILGIKVTFEKTVVAPYFFKDLDFASGHCEETAVSWKRKDGNIYLDITVGGEKTVIYDSKILKKGTHNFVIKEA